MSAPALPHCYRHPHREALVRCTRCDRPICPECMREASVGFHCPDDVAIARRGQRTPRSPVGAVLRDSPPLVTAAILALNVAAYLCTGLKSTRGLNSPDASALFQDWQLQPFAVHQDGSYYRLVTSAFLHVNLLHVATNMVTLVIIGPLLERTVGRWRLAALYTLSLLGGSAAIYVFGSPAVPVVGASGALFGLFGACLVMVRRLGLDLQWLAGIIVLNFVFTFSVPGISKLGHLGGFATGALAALAIGGLPNARARLPDRIQLGGLGALLALILASIALRSATGNFV